MKNRFHCLLAAGVILACPLIAVTQDADISEEASDEGEIETDRDSFTPSTKVAGCGLTIFESSYSFIDNRTTADTHSFPEILTRVGVTDRLELRVGWNYEAGGGGAVTGAESLGEIDTPGVETDTRFLYGAKVAVTREEDLVPQSALIVQATTPTSGVETATQIQVGYVIGWTLPNDWLLDSAIRFGTASEEGDDYHQWAPSIVLKVPVHEQWDIHAEYFGIFSDGRQEELSVQYFSPGVHYLISPNCEIGVRVGWGLSDDAANFFSNVGLGVRF